MNDLFINKSTKYKSKYSSMAGRDRQRSLLLQLHETKNHEKR